MKSLKILLVTFGVLFLSRAVWAQSLGTTNLVEGSPAGSDSVVLTVSGAWTAAANDSWLHLSSANRSGTASKNVVFTVDANPGATRTGTLTIAGQTLPVTQAGSTYGAIANATTLVSRVLGYADGLAVDGAGNLYFTDSTNNAIKEWIEASNSVTTLVSSGLNKPMGVAVDGAGNIYIADTGNNAVKEWIAASKTVTTLVSSGLNAPGGLAVDGAGNVYIADTLNNVIKKWVATSNIVTTLVSSGLSYPYDVAVDVLGNVYIADSAHNAIKEWGVSSKTVTTLAASGLNAPTGLAVDGSGNVCIADDNNNAIKKWIAASSMVVPLMVSRLNSPGLVSMDAAGNVYISDFGTRTIKELPHAFVDSTSKVEPMAAGSDALPAVVPATVSLTRQFMPASDSPWLTISGVTNGVVSIAFTTNPAATRSAHVSLLGQNITVIQMGAPNYFLGATNLVEGPAAGIDTVALTAGSNWTATANDAWLHLNAANQGGVAGGTNVAFTFDSNTGVTRIGTMTIAGQTLTVTQAGSTYVAANPVPLVSTGLYQPYGVAVDVAGNVYISGDYGNNVKEWIAASNSVTTLVSSGLFATGGLAVDDPGNVYIADIGLNTIWKWTAANKTLTALVFSGLNQPNGVALDSAGNVYISDTFHGEIKEWVAGDQTVTALVSSGLDTPQTVAVDGAGNVYITDSVHSAVKAWAAANSTVSTLVSVGLSFPGGIAVDAAGNVYIADIGISGAITKWTSGNGSVSTLATPGLVKPGGVAVDRMGNIYITDITSNVVVELLSHTFLDLTAKAEPALAGGDALPAVLPATVNLTGPFAPASDAAWLNISGVTNGVVSFAFATNYTTNRTAHITLLGQRIAVTQASVVPPVLTRFTFLNSGAFQFGFTNNQGLSYTVWSSTNLALPFPNWTALSTLTNDGSGQYQFADPAAKNDVQRYYRVSSP